MPKELVREGGSEMSGTIELRVFMGLVDVFKKRNWPIPLSVTIEKNIIATELMKMLTISEKEVEIVFINGKVFLPSDGVIVPGDRVALVPPGTPGPYRVLMGFVKKE